jgi:UDP-N-acetylmuramoyl-tripeptide--D-alanyl-D-alanine ligase
VNICALKQTDRDEVFVETDALSLNNFLRVTGGRPLDPEAMAGLRRISVAGISIDSRSLQPGDVFFALQGERFDGHDFVDQALARGASAAVVSEKWISRGRGRGRSRKDPSEDDRPAGGPPTEQADAQAHLPLIVVDDPLQALQEVAAEHRRHLDLTIIGVTGTNGKTTTKDMLAAVLSTKGPTLKTEGNYNNQIGVPLTLLRLRPEHRLAVVEMGMSGSGEIRRSAAISRPLHGLITNIGPAHLLQMHDLETIARAKFELLEMLPDEGLAFLNADDQRLRSQTIIPPGRTKTFGMNPPAGTRAEGVRFLGKEGTKFTVPGLGLFRLHTWGQHNVYNALAAIAAGRELGVGADDLRNALEGFRPSPMRMERLEIGSVTVFNDAYNANPPSMRAALKVLAEIPAAGRRIAVLGDMRELGQEEIAAHRRIGRLAASLSPDRLITVGPLAAGIHREALSNGYPAGRAVHCDDAEQAVPVLREMIGEGDVVLLKASRAVHLEEILPHLATG